MFAAERAHAVERSSSLAAAPIEVRSALDRQAKIFIPAEPALTPVVDFETETDDNPEDAPEWPDASVEDAMRAEFSDRDAMNDNGAALTSRRARKAEDTLVGGPLPALDGLIAEIPDAVKRTLEELFRAQFSEVRRVPLAVLKKEAQSGATKP